MTKLKGYIEPSVFSSYRSRYKECIRVLNGLEKHLPESERLSVCTAQAGR